MATRTTPKGTKARPKRRPATVDELRSRKPREMTVSVCLDEDLSAALEDAEQAVFLAVTPEQKKAAAQALDAARDAAEGSTVTMLVRSVGRKAYDDLVLANPPTPVQVARAQADWLATVSAATAMGERPGQFEPPDWDAEKFAPALIAACAVEPALTLEEATSLFDEWCPAEVSALFTACVVVNTANRVVELGKGSGPTGG